jgi:tetratricopeptide (TPR) repeat protein
MIQKALELDSTEAEYQLVLVVILYVLGEEEKAQNILEEVLQREPNNIQALDVKQKYFTKKLTEQKSLLQNLLFLDPFDIQTQKDLKFVKYYYKVVPLLMTFVLLLSYLLQSQRAEFGFLEPFLFVGFVIVGVVGSKDWRLNIPFITTLVWFDAYFNVGDIGVSFGEGLYIIFQAVLFQAVFMGAFKLFSGLRQHFKTKLQQQQNNNTNPFFYFLFLLPFEQYEELDLSAMKRYYMQLSLLVVGSFFLVGLRYYIEDSILLKVLSVVVALYTATKAYKVFWILVVYIFMMLIILKDFSCDGCFYMVFLSIIVATLFSVPHNIMRRFSWMRD